MKKCLLFFSIALLLIACSKDDNTSESAPAKPVERTVLIYMSAENSLSSYVDSELEELKKGSVGLGNNALVIYVDMANSKNLPYIAHIKEGTIKKSYTFSDDPYSSDPQTLKKVLDYTAKHFPAEEYGIVLWGHASGWILEDSIALEENKLQAQKSSGTQRFKAYGIDSGNNSYSNNGKWINMSTLAKVLGEWNHLRFILADCCQFQCIESAYELRNVADYIIASPAEIPNEGAPYDMITKGLFEQSETFYQTIVDKYFEQVIPFNNRYSNNSTWQSVQYKINSRTPLSVIKTAELQQLADSTKMALQNIDSIWGHQFPNLNKQKLIYYRGSIWNEGLNTMYDMNDLILHNADSATYAHWKESFDKAVIYQVNAKDGWMTGAQIHPYVFGQDVSGNKTGNTVLTDERYGGVSMFIPQNRPGTKYDVQNQDIQRTAWYFAAGLNELGW